MKSKPRGSVNFRPGSNPNHQELNQMAKADSVHSTPPTNTSASNPPDGPDPQDSLYFPTDVSPEEVFQAIGRLRKDARDEIDHYVSRELEG
jgi:hypothetical protein